MIMANYALTRFSVRGEYDAVLSAMETQLETVNDGKTIRYVDIVKRGNEFVGVLLYDT